MRYRQSERRRRFFNESHSHRSVRTTPIYKDGGRAGYPAIDGGDATKSNTLKRKEVQKWTT
jgi:hypothetical protein